MSADVTLNEDTTPTEEVIWLIAFDGPSNLHEAGQLIEQHFTKCSVITGTEHTVSLSFSNIVTLSHMKEICFLSHDCKFEFHTFIPNRFEPPFVLSIGSEIFWV